MSACRTQRPRLNLYSRAGVAAMAPCLSQLSCFALRDDVAWKAAIDVCWKEGQREVVVNDRDRVFCDNYALSWFECGYQHGVDDCRRQYAMWADSVVVRLASCANEPTCQDLKACDAAVWTNL